MSTPVFLVCLVAVIILGFILGRSTKARDKANEPAEEQEESWISIAEASRGYGDKKAWIYYRVRKGLIPKRIENGRIVVSEAWFKLRFDPELSKITTGYLERSFISQRITSKEYGDGKTTRLQRIESNTDAR